ncbi:hypothetical protein GF312_01330 [Candidatus Poribacteria bacterium]|nr:hypothetical protein [Candidatus Poribacteria bacterium]
MLIVSIIILTIILTLLSVDSVMAIDLAKFTERARMVINYASEEAKRQKLSRVDTEHLLLGLLHEGQGIAVRALQEIDINLETLETEVKELVKKQSGSGDSTENNKEEGEIEFTKSAQKIIENSMEEAYKVKQDYVGTEHILLGLLRSKKTEAARLLNEFEVTEEKIRQVLMPIGSIPANRQIPRFDKLRDGTQDATENIQRDLDKAGEAGGEVFLPPGRYRLDGNLTIPPGVTLRGTWTSPHHARLNTGTVLLAYAGRDKENDPPLISISPNGTVQGLTIYYPEQTLEDIKPYPWTIQGRGMHNSIIDVTIVNPYKAIDIGSYHNELHYIRNVFGCPLKIGVYINNCTDIGRIENVHFNPHYWARDEGDGEPRPQGGKLIDYLLKEGRGFVFGRTDWEYVINTFCFGYKIGYHFIATEQGVCNGNFLGIGADGTENAVFVEQSAPYGILITNGEFVSMRAKDPVEIIVGPENTGTISFNNCAFWGPANQIARIAGDGFVSFLQCNFVYWDHAKKKAAAVEATGGNVSVQNCNFQHDAKKIHLGSDVNSAIIRGNQMMGEIDITNESSGSVQIGFNVVY